MVSILWGSSAIDELIEKSTSEFVPSGQLDLGLQLEISDKIRSKKVNAKEAMQAMKKRLGHKNPNVQLATLSLVDTCVKNSGDSFVREIASREFLDDLVALMKQPITNIDVKNKILETIQTWGIAAKGNPSITYMTGTYSLLRAEGYMFPTVQQKIDPILFETSSAPEWTDSDVCERCRTSFTITNRKHHCRNCGGTFCQDCSSRTLPLPHLAINESVRVCDGCHLKLKMSKVPGINNLPPLPSPTSHSATTTLPNQIHSQNNNNNNNDSYDDDIKKAIELSLKEDEQRKKGYGSGYIPSNINKDDNQPTSQLTNINEEEDQELVAAIAASLRDMEVSSPPQVNYEYASRPSSNDLTPIEIENIQLFSTFITQLQSQGKTIPDDPETSKLIGQIGSLQPKIVKSLDDTIHKHRAFVELHDKINKAVQSFDHILEQRMSNYRNDSILTTHNSTSTTPNNISNYGYYQSQPTTISTPLQHHHHSQQQQQPYLMNPQYNNNISVNSQPTIQNSNNEPSSSVPLPPSQQQQYQYQYQNQTYSQSIPQTHTQPSGPVNQQPNNDQPLIDLS
ncbi:unnamed protein product [Cunninghamella echinulata]